MRDATSAISGPKNGISKRSSSLGILKVFFRNIESNEY